MIVKPSQPNGTIPSSESVGNSIAEVLTIPGIMAEAWHAGYALDLGKEELTFIAGIHAYLNDRIEAVVDEGKLRELYVPLNELIHGDPETMAQRSTRLIARLKLQGLLLRTDLGGISTEGEFTLSPLGMALGEYMEGERILTRQSLEFMLVRMRTELAAIVAATQIGGDTAHWETQVVMPLRFVVLQLVASIDQRQRGLDAIHIQLRTDISKLFEQSWVKAVDTCTAMLVSVGDTLRELNAVLAEHTESLSRMLLEIGDINACPSEVTLLTERARNQLLRIRAWSDSRINAWTDYFRTVNEYIRLVIQVDPDNRLRTRLRDQLRQYPAHPYTLLGVEPEPFRHLRTVQRATPETVLQLEEEMLNRRGIENYEAPLDDPINVIIERLVERLEQAGKIDLVAAVLEEATGFTDEQWFTLLARATPSLLRLGISPNQIVRQAWIPFSPRLEAQSLQITTRPQKESDLGL
ncbi:hypothetical protein [Chromobacterium violaceum]|uniref:hypothetical protein n=1 Tax=Chromobacterium violaceum TaxID=536 RepID=UPI001B327216|nr:hypothetical protein [Chromobacterium violaceum]MBP4045424.1 hypothetical protein [Chromobacterium violaceum]